jgi:hypothetical protein
VIDRLKLLAVVLTDPSIRNLRHRKFYRTTTGISSTLRRKSAGNTVRRRV